MHAVASLQSIQRAKEKMDNRLLKGFYFTTVNDHIYRVRQPQDILCSQTNAFVGKNTKPVWSTLIPWVGFHAKIVIEITHTPRGPKLAWPTYKKSDYLLNLCTSYPAHLRVKPKSTMLI